MCMFKALHGGKKSKAGEQPVIRREEFYSFYEVQGMRWKQVGHITVTVHSSILYRRTSEYRTHYRNNT